MDREVVEQKLESLRRCSSALKPNALQKLTRWPQTLG